MSRLKLLILDANVVIYLHELGRSDQGISLEEVLQKVGLKRPSISWSRSNAFRERHTKQGEIDAIQGIGLKRKKK
jgi:nucleotidyltransferase/DNA polymerase involved in DNA repair